MCIVPAPYDLNVSSHLRERANLANTTCIGCMQDVGSLGACHSAVVVSYPLAVIIVYYKGRQMSSLFLKKIKEKNIPKPLDKPFILCYNKM